MRTKSDNTGYGTEKPCKKCGELFIKSIRTGNVCKTCSKRPAKRTHNNGYGTDRPCNNCGILYLKTQWTGNFCNPCKQLGKAKRKLSERVLCSCGKGFSNRFHNRCYKCLKVNTIKLSFEVRNEIINWVENVEKKGWWVDMSGLGDLITMAQYIETDDKKYSNGKTGEKLQDMFDDVMRWYNKNKHNKL